jgi:hypothetical protein
MTATWSSGRLPRRSSTSTPGEQAVVFLGESRHRLGPHPAPADFQPQGVADVLSALVYHFTPLHAARPARRHQPSRTGRTAWID